MAAVAQFVAGLKSRNRDLQNKAAQDLFLYVKTELREMPQEELVQFFDDFNHHIFDMVSSPDANEKKGGVLAISEYIHKHSPFVNYNFMSFAECLISGDVVNTTTRISRYSNNLRNLLPSNDVSVMEIAAKTLVKLALLPGSKGAESFEFDIKRAFEWLSEERNEGKRHAAVLVLRELAVAMPTFFYQQVSGFFEHIFNAVRDPKSIIREGAGQALRAALVVTSQRESAKQLLNKPMWYQQCFDQALLGFSEVVPLREKGVTKEDRVHGALIVLDELLRCSNIAWERRYASLRFLKPITHKHLSEDFGYILPRLKAPFGEKVQHTQPPVQTSSLYDFEVNKYSTVNNQESAICRQILVNNYADVCAKIMEQRGKAIYINLKEF